jgi:hypothetical protein
MLLPVYKTNLNTDLVPWELIYKELDSVSETWRDSVNSRSTLTNKSKRYDMQDWAENFRNAVVSIVHKFMPDATNLDYEQIVIESWFNRIYPSGHATKHDHGSSDLSIVWYINKPKDSGNIVIEVNGQDYEVEVTTGDLIAFPGSLPHYTKENASSLCRYVLVVDLKVGLYGPEHLNEKVRQRRQERLIEDLSTWYQTTIKDTQ